jgi:hypothetical protein
MDAEEGRGVTFGIVPIERETVILRDLLAQGFPVGGKVGILTHTSQYEPSPTEKPRAFLAASCPRSECHPHGSVHPC